MTIEEKLKAYILTKYRSMREFTQSIGIPYSTMTTILKRGIENSNVLNIIKICQELEISADELAAGRIVPVASANLTPLKIEDIIGNAKQQLLSSSNLTLNGQLLDEAEIKGIVNSLDLILEIEKRRMI